MFLNLFLPEEIEDEETPELTANEVDVIPDKEEWERIQKGHGKAKEEEQEENGVEKNMEL